MATNNTDSPASPPSGDWQMALRLAIKTGLQLIPLGIGGAISVAIFDTMAERQTKRLQNFTRELAETLEKHAAKVDVSFFQTDEFQSIFRKSLQAVAKEHQELKLRLLGNLLARISIEGKPASYDFDAYVLSLIESLTAAHFALLFALPTPSQGFARVETIAKSLGAPRGHVESILDHLVSLGLAIGAAGMARIAGEMVSGHAGYAISGSGIAVRRRAEDVLDETLRPANTAQSSLPPTNSDAATSTPGASEPTSSPAHET